MDKLSILFVCTANICRSPMAEAVFKAKRADFGGEGVFKTVASAGVHADPRGGPIDARALACLNRHGYQVERRWRSHRVDPATDFERYDLILAMEEDHLDAMRAKATPEQAAKMRLLLDFAPGLAGRDLPDPYFGPANGFDIVLGMVESAVLGLGAAWRDGRLTAR